MPTRRSAARFLGSFGVQILGAMAIGLVLGIAARAIGPATDGTANALAIALETLGSVFVQLLKALVPPLIFTAIVASIANLHALGNGARLAAQTLLWFTITALIAVVIGIVLGIALQPGLHEGAAALTPAAAHARGGWLDFLKGIIPANVLGLTATTKLTGETPTTSLSFNTLQIVVLSIAIGIAALRVGEAAEPFLAFARSILAIVRKLLWWVIRLTPLGTIGLLGTATAQYGWDALAQLGAFAGAVYLGLAIVLFVVYPLLLAAHGLSPWCFFRGAWPAIQLGFVSRSSIGTLPVTETLTEERLGVPRGYAAFAVPLGATTKMDGCAAIYPAIAALFVAQFYGVPLGFTDYALIAFVSVVGSAATAGVTGAIVMLTLTLSTLGLPLEGVGLLVAIDPIIDMGRTAVNVAGQALVPVIVAKRETILDEAVFAGRSVGASIAPDSSPWQGHASS